VTEQKATVTGGLSVDEHNHGGSSKRPGNRFLMSRRNAVRPFIKAFRSCKLWRFPTLSSKARNATSRSVSHRRFSCLPGCAPP
jgi:hypothetical protein